MNKATESTYFVPAGAETLRRVNLSEICRLLLLVALPLNQVVSIGISGTTLNLTEFLAPIYLVAMFFLLLRDSFPVKRYLGIAFVLLCALVAAVIIVIVFAQGGSALLAAKIAIGYAFVFLTYFLFSRARPDQAQRHLHMLTWIGGIVALASIAVGFSSFSARLNSIFWGRSNLFAAALLLTIAAGVIGILLYKRWSLLLPMGLSVVAIVLTQSRGAFLLLVVMVGAMLVVRSQRTLMALVGIGVAALFVGGLILVAPPDTTSSVPLAGRLVEEAQAITDYIQTGSERDKRLVMSGRLVLWSDGMEQIRHYPWTGIPEKTLLYPSWATGDTTNLEALELTFHSWAINVPATLGLPVLFLNLLLLVAALVPYLRRSLPIQMQLIRVILFVMLVYALAEPMFESGFMQLNIIGLLFWILAGIGINLPDPVQRSRRFVWQPGIVWQPGSRAQ